MIVRMAALSLVLLSALLLQSVVTPAASIGSVRPDLLLLTVVGLALEDGPGTGVRYGFAAGLTLDLLSGVTSLVGISTLLLMLIGYAVGLLRPYLAGNGIPGQVVVGAAAGAISVLGTGLLQALLGFPDQVFTELAGTALIAAGYAALLSPFVCQAVQAVSRRFPAPSASTAGVR